MALSTLSESYLTNVAILILAVAVYWKIHHVDNFGFVIWSVVLFYLSPLILEKIRLIRATKQFRNPTTFQLTYLQLEIGKATANKDDDGKDLISDNEVDIRFVEACRGDMVEAKRRYLKMLNWRKVNNIDEILLKPHPNFQMVKDSFMHIVHKKDKAGHLITIEKAGNVKKNIQNFLANGGTDEDVIYHLAFYQEYLWRVLDSRPFPEGYQLKIIDFADVSMSDVSNDVFTFMKKCGQVVGDNTPERIFKIFVVNPPSWFNVIWKIVSPLLNPKTKDKTHVIRGQKEIAKALLEYVDAENLPAEYGGQCTCVGGCLINSPEEVELRDYVGKLNTGTNCQSHLEDLMKKHERKTL